MSPVDMNIKNQAKPCYTTAKSKVFPDLNSTFLETPSQLRVCFICMHDLLWAMEINLQTIKRFYLQKFTKGKFF